MSTINEPHFKGLWVDDIRPLPSDLQSQGWTCAKSAWEALVKLELIEFESVSLDHDLSSFVGNKEINGNDILVWLIDRKVNGLYVPKYVMCHSANPEGIRKMREDIKRYWG